MARWLFLPDSTLRDLATLASLSERNIAAFQEFLNSDAGDNLYVSYVKIADALGISDQDSASLYAFWEYVQREKRECNQSAGAVVSEFVSFLDTKARISSTADSDKYKAYSKSIAQKSAHLENLFGAYPSRDIKQKSHSLESGPLPHISNFKAYCDIRPIYDNSGSEIVDCRPIVTLRVAIHDTLGDHKEFFVQISESNINMIELEFQRLRDKLKSLHAALPRVIGHMKENKSKGDGSA